MRVVFHHITIPPAAKLHKITVLRHCEDVSQAPPLLLDSRRFLARRFFVGRAIGTARVWRQARGVVARRAAKQRRLARGQGGAFPPAWSGGKSDTEARAPATAGLLPHPAPLGAQGWGQGGGAGGL